MVLDFILVKFDKIAKSDNSGFLDKVVSTVEPIQRQKLKENTLVLTTQRTWL